MSYYVFDLRTCLMLKPRSLTAALVLAAMLSPAAYADSAAKSFTVTNNGSGPLAVSGASISGNAEYKLTGNTCGTAVPVGGNCALTVTFTPTGTGPRAAAALNFTSNGTNGPNHSISLSGAGGYTLVSPHTPAVTSCKHETWLNTGFSWMWVNSSGCTDTAVGTFRFQTLVDNTTGADLPIRVSAAADNGATLYVDGAQVSPFRHYAAFDTWLSYDTVLSPGVHRVELHVVNDTAYANPGAFSAAIVNKSNGQVIRSTNDVSAWSYY
jgi:hypothetical protein